MFDPFKKKIILSSCKLILWTFGQFHSQNAITNLFKRLNKPAYVLCSDQQYLEDNAYYKISGKVTQSHKKYKERVSLRKIYIYIYLLCYSVIGYWKW